MGNDLSHCWDRSSAKSENARSLGINGMVGATEFAYIAAHVDDGNRYHRPDQLVVAGPASVKGTVAKFVAANPALVEQMRNTALACPKCGKSNATILPFCNGCDADLKGAEKCYTENVCLAFMYGIESLAKFPAKLSMRYQSAECLCYDDLLARGSCHLNAIPGGTHLPEWKHLLRNPAKGLEIVRMMDDTCFRVLKEQFWESEWKASTLGPSAPTTVDEFRPLVYAGMNSVPSQFQIHLQYMVPPIQPVDYHAFLHGKRFVKYRWLPLEYVFEALEAFCRASISVPDAPTLSEEECFARIKEVGGPDYEVSYKAAICRYNQTHIRCSNWNPENFDCVVVTPAAGPFRPELDGSQEPAAKVTGAKGDAPEVWNLLTKELEEGKTVSDLEKTDKQKLQSYGRPYESGKPVARSYYQHARVAGAVQTSEEWMV